jgi:hypothetical protein
LLDRIAAGVSSTPGVVKTAIGRPPDGGGLRSAGVAIDGQKTDAHSAHAYLFYKYIDASYFDTLGIPMVYGHGFTPPHGMPEPVVVLSEAAAQQLWPGKDPIGHTLQMTTDGQFHDKDELVPDGPAYQVIGVAHNVRGALLDNSDAFQIYLAMSPERRTWYPLLVRTSVPSGQLIHAIAPAIAAVDSNIAVTSATLDDLLRQTPPFMISSIVALIAGTVGLLGLLLSAMGIYGTLSYIVVQRTREVGIRMALGARKVKVLVLVLRQSSAPVLLGLLAGSLAATGDSYLLRGVLYGVGRLDGISYLIISGLFVSVGCLASCIPARRATRIEPAVALRCE